jgi:hypothetical protein
MTRTVMTGSALALALAISLGGCRDNEESFYVEHMKSLPEPPECKVSTGDPVIPGLTIDLALASGYDFYAWFQVTNGLMAREEYDNLKAESNGILIDGAESAVSIGGQAVGGSEYREVNLYIAPESTAVAPGIALSAQGLIDLAASLGCPSVAASVDAVVADLADGTLDNPPVTTSLGEGYGEVRFLGHTQGGTEVETNPFSFAISLCCNCFVNWLDVSDPCVAFCDDPMEYSSCNPGVNDGDNLYPAHNATYGRLTAWDSTTADGGVDDCTGC